MIESAVEEVGATSAEPEHARTDHAEVITADAKDSVSATSRASGDDSEASYVSGRLTLDRSLELAFAMNGNFESVYSELRESEGAAFPVFEGTLVDKGINNQGFHNIEYETPEGDFVNQWYSDGKVIAEEVVFEDGETKLTRWYRPGTNILERVTYTTGKKVASIEYDTSSRPSAVNFWDGRKHVGFNVED